MKVFGCLLVTFLMVSCQKDADESRPYEFGFTIDGQQHRHEKKDVNGIIQGEFGFITADGIYHVTVYATDENGNFRILSMRNVRISAPLDGSPLPPGAKIESYPGVGSPAPVQKQQQPQVNIPSTTLGPRTPVAFTTKPTIKPACAGCGYVTTPKPRPGEKFPFQTPAFQNPGQPNGPVSNQDHILVDPPRLGPQVVQNLNFPSHSGPQTNQDHILVDPPRPGPQVVQNPNFPSHSGPQTNQDHILVDPPRPGPQTIRDPVGPQTNPNSPNTAPNSPPTRNENDLADRPRRPLSQVSVSDGVIRVPGNPDIPIKDKYPGMVDGLPDGIKEKDITDLLYKFNYTVGFHGHYEKGLKNGAKIGGYFVTGRDGISRIVTYVADENGFRPKVRFVRLDLNSDEVPKEGTEKTFGLKNFEFVWYPVS